MVLLFKMPWASQVSVKGWDLNRDVEGRGSEPFRYLEEENSRQ